MQTFLTRGGENTRFTQAKHVFIISSQREDGVIQLLWRNDRTFNEAIHTQAPFYILKRIPYVNDRMTHGELEVLAYVRVEAHDIDILYSFILSCLIVETHGLGLTPIQSITIPQRTLGMHVQIRPPCIFKLTFLLNFDQVAHSCHML